jgi:hypothetical protein
MVMFPNLFLDMSQLTDAIDRRWGPVTAVAMDSDEVGA